MEYEEIHRNQIDFQNKVYKYLVAEEKKRAAALHLMAAKHLENAAELSRSAGNIRAANIYRELLADRRREAFMALKGIGAFGYAKAMITPEASRHLQAANELSKAAEEHAKAAYHNSKALEEALKSGIEKINIFKGDDWAFNNVGTKFNPEMLTHYSEKTGMSNAAWATLAAKHAKIAKANANLAYIYSQIADTLK